MIFFIPKICRNAQNSAPIEAPDVFKGKFHGVVLVFSGFYSQIESINLTKTLEESKNLPKSEKSLCLVNDFHCQYSFYPRAKNNEVSIDRQ